MATFRKQANGKIQAVIRIQGYKPVSKTFHNKHLANRWSRSTEDSMKSGTWLDQDEDYPVADLLENYLNTITDRACYATDKYAIKPLCRHLGCFKASTLTKVSIAEYSAVRGNSVAPATIRKELGLLQRALKLIDHPFKVKLPAEDNQPVVIPKDYELDVILGNCSEVASAAIEFASITGMRRGEIVNIRPEHRTDKILLIPKTKNGYPRSIPLATRARAILDEYPVFSITGRSLSQAFRRAADRTGAGHLTFHSLRHYACTQLFRLGLSVMEVSSITGHRDIRMLSRYTHIQAEHLLDKIQ